MGDYRAGLFVVLLLAGWSCVWADEEKTLEALRRGGYVLFLTHAPAEQPHPHTYLAPPECTPGTRLIREGWIIAREAGVGLRKQGVRVEVAYASPVCAARHTAYLLFGADRVRLDERLARDCGVGKGDEAFYAAHLRTLIAQLPRDSGFNNAIVAHPCTLQSIAEPGWPPCATRPSPASGVVLKAHPGRVDWVGCLPSESLLMWSNLAEF